MGLVVSENELADQIVPAEIQLIKKNNKKRNTSVLISSCISPTAN